MIPPVHPDATTLVLRRVFMASRQRVFRAWTEPEALQRWFRPGGMSVTVSSLDVRVGGSFRFVLADKNALFGTYLHIAPPEKLVFTWCGDRIGDHETIVTLDFLDQGPTTEVVLTHERLATPEMLAMFSGGWSSLFTAFAEVLATHPDF